MNSNSHNTISTWVGLFSDDLYTWAYHKTKKMDLAEDLVQETFIKAFNAIDDFQEKSSPKTWLFRILNNLLIDHYRKNAKYKTENLDEAESLTNGMFDSKSNWQVYGFEDFWAKDENVFDDSDFNHIFDFCMSDLPESWRLAVSAKYLLQMETVEICQELEITASNYWQMVHRAKLMLKKCLETKWFSKV
jgi:RNA polymerase sigma-70 factor (ECF subfamily)